MPHIKTYVRYSASRIFFALLTSANLSGAAWGSLNKSGRFMVRSYELGALFLPSLYVPESFSLLHGRLHRTPRPPGEARLRAEFERPPPDGGGDGVKHDVVLPIPYRLPPPKYAKSDRPWFWDGQFTKPDVFGRTWPP
mmetsp:Transcript_4315/g.13024  ORF Transcript_4315/g.13024 Transcript_4315/m.13024 type:complete len:138 (+) Transcript_4315:1421-1834(+)